MAEHATQALAAVQSIERQRFGRDVENLRSAWREKKRVSRMGERREKFSLKNPGGKLEGRIHREGLLSGLCAPESAHLIALKLDFRSLRSCNSNHSGWV